MDRSSLLILKDLSEKGSCVPIIFQSSIMKHFIQSLALASSLASCLSAGEVNRPNILFLFADDLGRYASAYADPDQPSPNDIVRTPVFDRIAAEGALFTNAFVSSPSCTPCRGSVYTGRHFFRNGSASQLHHPWQEGAPDPVDGIEGAPNALMASGYHFGWTYKWHIPESLAGGKQNFYSRRGQRFGEYSEHLMEAADKAAAKQNMIDEVRGNFQDFLDRRQPGQPFFYSFNPTNTHRKWARGSGKVLWGLDPDALKGRLPPFVPDNEVTREDFADYLGEVMAFDMACGELLQMLAGLGELDRTLIVVTGDHGIPGFPRGKCNPTDFGAQVPLAMRWPHAIRKGVVVDAPVSQIDLAPTFLAAAGVSSKDDPDGQNLLPVLSARSGMDPILLRGWALIGRELHCHPARAGQLPYPTRALRTSDHLYVINFKPERWPAGDPLQVGPASAPSFDLVANQTRVGYADIDASPTKAWMVEHRNDTELSGILELAWGKRPAEELYDLKNDPHQMRNLAAEPGHAELKAKLRAQLMAELVAKKDPRLDNDAFDRPPYLAMPAKR